MKTLCRYLVVPIFLLLSGCELIFEQPTPPRLIGDTVEMAGIDQKSTRLNAEGPWNLTSKSSWLSVEPDNGFGTTLVELNVDAAGLEPDSYPGGFTFFDSESGMETFVPVAFSFPQLGGRVTDSSIMSLQAARTDPIDIPSGPGRLLVGLGGSDSGVATLAADQFHALAVEVASDVPSVELTKSLERIGVVVVETQDRATAAQELRELPTVLYVEPDIELELLALVNDPRRLDQWALDHIGANSAWDSSTGNGVRIAVIDAGFHPQHQDFRDNVVYTYDFGDDSSTIQPSGTICGTHGDHVAGIAAAVANNSQGVAGIAHDADLLLLDASTTSDCGPGSGIWLSSITQALNWVAGDASGPRADVVNLSVGTDMDLYSLHSAVQAAHDAGVTIVAAAGNNPPFSSIPYPAKYPEAIAVSATGRDDQLASYSVTGAEVFISAPGGDSADGFVESHSILSTITDSFSGYTYGYMEGTSMASPLVAGTVALILSLNENLGPADVAEILRLTSDDVGDPGRDPEYGYGLLDAAAAVDLAQNYIPASMTYLVRSGDGRVLTVPAEGSFDFGYTAPAPLTLEASSDDDGDGVPGETGELYGTVEHTVQFDGPIDYVEIPVSPR